MSDHESFTAQFPELPWRSMKGMRNRLAHGYFDINLTIVWETVDKTLPDLVPRLRAVKQAARDAGPDDASAGKPPTVR